MCDSSGERLKGSEAELAGAVGAVGMEEGDSDWRTVPHNIFSRTFRPISHNIAVCLKYISYADLSMSLHTTRSGDLEVWVFVWERMI